MKYGVYSVYDTATAMYLRPFYFQTDGQALRFFQDVSVSAESEIAKHPEDYTLFKLGEFDDNKGSFQGEHPKSLATALEMVAKSRQIDPGSLKEEPPHLQEVN